MLGNSWPFPLKSKKKSVTSLIQLLSDEQCIESLPFSSPTCLTVGFSLIDGRILTKSPCFSARPSALQFKGGFSLSERIFFPARNVKMSDQQPINAVPKAFLTTPVVSFFFSFSSFLQGANIDEPCAGLDCSRGCQCNPEKGSRVSDCSRPAEGTSATYACWDWIIIRQSRRNNVGIVRAASLQEGKCKLGSWT